MAVVIETTLGDFTVDLYIEDRPHTCKNFLKLCKMKYYNFCLFHSVQHNFIAQTGDPTGTGKNGQSVFGKIYGEEKKFFEAEMMPKLKHSRSGLLSMVNCGNNMLGSQFFLTLGYELQSLDNEHCIFGEVVEGHEILLKLNDVICDTEHRPYQDIRITHTIILEDPFDDPTGLLVPDNSPEPSSETLLNARIAPDEDLDETKGRSAAELEEMAREREAKAQATILEIVGDLPDAEIAPPENVLFVCKLNPVTTDDDLEIIFSRFGKVKGCEVIRDKVTGDSLQYAFVEFEEQKACEDAFFKMDNVLIDDRRIHVDFSQSVSKLRWKGKGRGVEHFDGQVNTNSSKRNSNNVQDHKQSKSINSKKKSVWEVGSYEDSSRSGKATEGSSRKAFKWDVKDTNERKDYVLKSDDHRRGNEAKGKNKKDPIAERDVACHEYLGSEDCYNRKHGSDGSRTNKNSHDSIYKDYVSSDRRHRYEDSSRVSSHGGTNTPHGNTKIPCMNDESNSTNKHRDENKTRVFSSQEDSGSSRKYRAENKTASRSSYQEELSSSNRHRDENKRGIRSRNERDVSYQEEINSSNRHRDENKQGSRRRNERDSSYQKEISSSNRHRDEIKRDSRSRNERDGSYQEEISSNNRHRDENNRGSKSRNERNPSYQDESGSRNTYTDENKRGRASENKNERDDSHHEVSLSSVNKYKEKHMKETQSTRKKSDSRHRERAVDVLKVDKPTRRNERDKRDHRYIETSGSVDPYRDEKRRGINTSNDETDISDQEGGNMIDGHRRDNTRDNSNRYNSEKASLRENTSGVIKRKESNEYGRPNREKRSESSSILKRVWSEAGSDCDQENEKLVQQTDLREKKVKTHTLALSDRKKGDTVIRGHGTSKKNADGRSVKSAKIKKRRSPSSSSSSSSDSESSSKSSSSSSDSSSSSSSDSSDNTSRAKRRKLSKRGRSGKQTLKSKKKNKGKKMTAKKSKKKESSSEETDSDSSSSTSSSSSSDNERKHIKSSKKV